MTLARFQLSNGVILDARRAVYLEEEGVLAVADLHLGYAWAHRHRGQLLPISAPEDVSERLQTLIDEYHPRVVALLGDIVHDTVPMAAFRKTLHEFLSGIEAKAEVRMIAGNHDRALAREIAQPLTRDWQAGRHRMIHGDGHSEAAAQVILDDVRSGGGLLIMGHEHPAIGISDRVAHYARVPCFLAGASLLVLPAFSSWAAGCDIHRRTFLSSFPLLCPAQKAIAILAGKLLPIPQSHRGDRANS